MTLTLALCSGCFSSISRETCTGFTNGTFCDLRGHGRQTHFCHARRIVILFHVFRCCICVKWGVHQTNQSCRRKDFLWVFYVAHKKRLFKYDMGGFVTEWHLTNMKPLEALQTANHGEFKQISSCQRHTQWKFGIDNPVTTWQHR